MQNLIVRPEHEKDFYPVIVEDNKIQTHALAPNQIPVPVQITVIQPKNNDIARYAGEAFAAIRAQQDEYGNKISETYASNEKVENLKSEVETLKEHAENFAEKTELENFVSHDQMNEKVQQVEQAAMYGTKIALENYGLPEENFATAADIDNLF